MKNSRWSLALTVFSILIFSAACDKKGEPQPPTKTELMTLATWKFQSATYGGTDVSTAPQIACLVDNTITFTGASYTATEGTTVCTPTTAGTGTWSFSGADSLQLSNPLIPGGANKVKLNSLSATTLVLQQDYALTPPAPAQPFVVTFKH